MTDDSLSADPLTEILMRAQACRRAAFSLLLPMDLIVTDSVATVATNGLDVLVHPVTGLDRLRRTPLPLLVAALDALFLHASHPAQLDFAHRPMFTALRTRRALHELGFRVSLDWQRRLVPPPEGVDLARTWSLRRCLARRWRLACGDGASLLLTGLEDRGPCWGCEAGEHEAAPLAGLDDILRGSPLAPRRMPVLAADCLRLVLDLMAPGRTLEERLHGLDWLAQVGSPIWFQTAVMPLLVSGQPAGLRQAIRHHPRVHEEFRRMSRVLATSSCG